MSRRDVLKKSVVAGGIVWAAPTILASSAAADTTIGACVNCPTGFLYGLKFDSSSFNAPGASACTGVGGGATCVTEPPGGVASGCCLITLGLISASASGGTTTITLQPGVQFCAAASKGAGQPPDACENANVNVAAGPNGTTIITITQPTQSHTEIIVCHRGSVPLANCTGT